MLVPWRQCVPPEHLYPRRNYMLSQTRRPQSKHPVPLKPESLYFCHDAKSSGCPMVYLNIINKIKKSHIESHMYTNIKTAGYTPV
jgi:hypothetical protein